MEENDLNLIKVLVVEEYPRQMNSLVSLTVDVELALVGEECLLQKQQVEVEECLQLEEVVECPLLLLVEVEEECQNLKREEIEDTLEDLQMLCLLLRVLF